MKKETELWVDKAIEDFRTVEILLHNNGPSGIICFHCQQAAEKFIKAFLVEKNIEFPRTHDLLLLIESFILPFDDTFREILPTANELVDFAISIRYPGPDIEIDAEAAREAYQATVQIKSFVLARINSTLEF